MMLETVLYGLARDFPKKPETVLRWQREETLGYEEAEYKLSSGAAVETESDLLEKTTPEEAWHRMEWELATRGRDFENPSEIQVREGGIHGRLANGKRIVIWYEESDGLNYVASLSFSD